MDYSNPPSQGLESQQDSDSFNHVNACVWVCVCVCLTYFTSRNKSARPLLKMTQNGKSLQYVWCAGPPGEGEALRRAACGVFPGIWCACVTVKNLLPCVIRGIRGFSNNNQTNKTLHTTCISSLMPTQPSWHEWLHRMRIRWCTQILITLKLSGIFLRNTMRRICFLAASSIFSILFKLINLQRFVSVW